MTFMPEQNIGALVEGETVYVRVDAFNENGITPIAMGEKISGRDCFHLVHWHFDMAV